MTMIGTLNFYTVQGWMVSELHLTGNELLAYAVIYGFSQDGASAFRGTLAYIAEWLGCSKSSAHRTLRRLTERGLIEASADGGGWACKPVDAIRSVNTAAPEAFQNGTEAAQERSETERTPYLIIITIEIRIPPKKREKPPSLKKNTESIKTSNSPTTSWTS